MLAPGAGVRARAERAIVGSLLVAALYATFTVVTDQSRTLNLGQPWRDDPDHVLVSLDLIALPLLVLVGAARAALCRRDEQLPARRVSDLLRVAAAVTGLGLATQLAEWTAVAAGAHRPEWTTATLVELGVLAVLTTATVAAAALAWRAGHALGRVTELGAQPDWLTDAVALGRWVTGLLGPLRGVAGSSVDWVDRHVVTQVRAHPVVAAALLAGVLSAPQVVAKIVLEGYPAPLVLVVSAVAVASSFAFIMLAGAYLRVVGTARARPSVQPVVAVAACVGAMLGVAFRDALYPIVGLGSARETVAMLAGSMLGGAVIIGSLTLLVLTAVRGRATTTCRRPSSRP